MKQLIFFLVAVISNNYVEAYSPKQVVEYFYRGYVKCTEQQEYNDNIDCIENYRNFIDPSLLTFFKKMGNELDYNYFLSGQDFDADYVIKTFKIISLRYISADHVKLKVKFFSSPSDSATYIHIFLKKHNGIWKIKKITRIKK